MIRARFFIAILVSTRLFAFDHSHTQWTACLATYQDETGQVKYSDLKKDVAKDPANSLTRYLAELTAVKKTEFDAWKKEQQMAFLINAYNSFTFKLIIDNYPVKSIRDIGRLFKKAWKVEFFKILDGEITQLDPIEHDWLRPKYKDYRIHAAVNCASISCPKLQHVAFIADKLEAQLESAFKDFMMDDSRNRFDAGGVFYLSKIFDWFEKDFEVGGGVLSVVQKYGGTKAKETAQKGGKVKYLDYDWNLNEVPERSVSSS